MRRRSIGMKTIAAFALLCVAGASVAAEQPYPTKPVRFIIGPGPDALARVIGEKLTAAWGQQILVDQRGGGGGSISAEIVARAQPDGYTVLLATGTHLILPSLYKVPFDMEKDFAPVTLAASTPFILAVHPSVQAKSVAELIQLAKAKPGVLNYGTGGSGTPPHLGTELFKTMTGVNMVHVPYKTVAAAITELIAGQVQVMFTVAPSGLPQVRAGRIRGLAVSTLKRSAFAPELPTVAESGLPGFDVTAWNGILAPARTPKPVVAKFHDGVINALKMPDVLQRLEGLGFEPVGNTPEEFAQFVRVEIARWAKVIRTANVKAE
jgi:tripartite-type tricarboxylate transporter receptor subunit TctC